MGTLVPDSIIDAKRNRIDPDVLNSSVSASEAIYGIASETRKTLGGGTLEALVIGTHPYMGPAVGERLIRSAAFPERCTTIIDTPQQVIERLRQLIHVRYREFDIIIAAFELHHVDSRDFRECMELLQWLCHGTVLVTDFAVKDAPANAVVDMARRKIDRDQLRLNQGPGGWHNNHKIFTEASFYASMDGDWKSENRFRLPDFGVGFAASNDFTQAELQTCVSKALSSNSHTADILSRVYHRKYGSA